MTFSARAAMALVCALALMATGCAELRELSDLPELKAEDTQPSLTPQTSRIYDADDQLITTFHGAKNRTVIGIDEMPQHLLDAVVAIEDERYWEHDGVDFEGIARAAVANIKDGAIRQGGSTITQQYVKNRIIAPDGGAARTIERKLDEAALARQLEKKLDKDTILQRYLNSVYFGNGAYGVQAAAKTYFGKPAKRLSVKESATLAATIKAPERFDPYDNPERTRERRDLVVAKMSELGKLGPKRAAKVKDYPLGLVEEPGKKRHEAPYFVDWVKRMLVFHPRFSFLGDSPADRSERLFTGGLRIYTTVNMRHQRAAERAVGSVLTESDDPYASLVAMDPRDGQVKAMVGGRDFFKEKGDDFAKLNLAITGQPNLGRSGTGEDEVRRAPGTGRQAGSAFKPFALAAALEEGVPLSTKLQAPECKSFEGADNGEPWKVCNYGGASYGTVSLEEATFKSINVAYAELILGLGPDAVVRTADRIGINTDLSAVPSATLGTNPVNPLGMTSAFGTFATNGEHHRPVGVRRIEDHSGKVLFEDDSSAKRRLDAGAAFLTTSALEKVIERGTGTAARIGRPAAGKTGTAQEYRDAWFVGYVPQLVASVWVGYPEASIEMKPYCGERPRSECRPTRIQVSGGTWPTTIWQRYMSEALERYPVRDFDVPRSALEKVVIDVRTGCEPTQYTPSSQRRTVRRIPGAGPSAVECSDRNAKIARAAEAAKEAAEKAAEQEQDQEDGTSEGAEGSDADKESDDED